MYISRSLLQLSACRQYGCVQLSPQPAGRTQRQMLTWLCFRRLAGDATCCFDLMLKIPFAASTLCTRGRPLLYQASHSMHALQSGQMDAWIEGANQSYLLQD